MFKIISLILIIVAIITAFVVLISFYAILYYFKGILTKQILKLRFPKLKNEFHRLETINYQELNNIKVKLEQEYAQQKIKILGIKIKFITTLISTKCSQTSKNHDISVFLWSLVICSLLCVWTLNSFSFYNNPPTYISVPPSSNNSLTNICQSAPKTLKSILGEEQLKWASERPAIFRDGFKRAHPSKQEKLCQVCLCNEFGGGELSNDEMKQQYELCNFFTFVDRSRGKRCIYSE